MDPVVYHSQSGQAYNLLTGKRVDSQSIEQYPLYDYREMLVAWLEARGVQPVVDREDLRLSPRSIRQWLQQKRNPPLPNPFRREDCIRFNDPYGANSDAQRQFGLHPALSKSKKGIQALVIDELDPALRGEVLHYKEYPFVFLSLKGKRVIVFKNKVDRDHFLNTPPKEEADRDFLLSLSREARGGAFWSQEVLTVFEKGDYTEITQLNIGQLRILAKAHHRANGFFIETTLGLKEFSPVLSKDPKEKQKLSDALSGSPFVEKYLRGSELLQRRIQQDPVSFLRFYNSLPLPKKQAFTILVDYRYAQGLYQVLADPQQVRWRPTPRKLIPIVVSLEYNKDQKGPVLQHQPDQSSSQASLLLDAESFALLTLNLFRGSKEQLKPYQELISKLVSRWDQALYHEFTQLPRDDNFYIRFILFCSYISEFDRSNHASWKPNPLTPEEYRQIYPFDPPLPFIDKVPSDAHEVLLAIKKRRLNSATHP